jgi:hypothetical protein
MGADDGSCELILGTTRGGGAMIDWVMDGLRLGENPAWEEITDG